MSYLIDTYVLSEWRKPAPDPGVVAWFAEAAPDDLYLSVITIGEIRRGIAKLQLRRDYRQAATYEAWLVTTRELFADRVVPISADIAEEWGSGDARTPISMADGLIAATARIRGWTVVTRNAKDFEGTGARILNPFTD